MSNPMNGPGKQEFGVMRDPDVSSDSLFIALWLVVCILLVLVAGLSAARPPVNLTGYHEAETLAGTSRRAPEQHAKAFEQPVGRG